MNNFSNSTKTKRVAVNRILFIIFTIMGIPFAAAWAGPTLKSADLAVIARNTDLDDQFALVALADIPGSSVIFLSDEGWDDNDFTFDGYEDVFKWTVHASGIQAGSIIHFTNESTSTLEIMSSAHGTLSHPNGSSDLNLSAGDQLFIYQTSDDTYNGTIQRLDNEGAAEPGMIYAFNGDNSSPNTYGWLDPGNSHTSAASQLPDNMTVLTTADGTGNARSANGNGMLTQGMVKEAYDYNGLTSGIDEYDNYRYDGSIDPATKEDWLVRIHTTANWLASDIDTLGIFQGALGSDWVVMEENLPPVISFDNSILSYTENSGPVQVDAAALVTDPDGDADWNYGIIEVQITANSTSSDMLSIPDFVVGGINTSGTDLFNGTMIIGTLSSSEGSVAGSSILVITLNSNATNALVQEVTRAIHYENRSEDPASSNRTITITVSDANLAAALDERIIAVTSVPDAPYVVVNNGLKLNEGATRLIPLDSLECNDPDSDNASLTYTLTLTPVNGQLETSDNPGVSITSFTQQDLVDGKIYYVHNGSNTTSDSFTFKVSDGVNELSGQTFSIAINPVYDAPQVEFNATGLKGAESVGSVDVQLDLSFVSERDISVDFTVTGTATGGGIDYILADGTISISAGELIGHLVIESIVDDGEIEEDETLVLTLSNPVNANLGTNTEFVYTIEDNDSATGIQEILVIELLAYPNPCSDRIYVDHVQKDMTRLIITDLSGKILVEAPYLGEKEIEVGNLTPGIYVLAFINDRGEKQQCILVKG